MGDIAWIFASLKDKTRYITREILQKYVAICALNTNHPKYEP